MKLFIFKLYIMEPTFKKFLTVIVELIVLSDGTSCFCVREPNGRPVHYFTDKEQLVALFSELSECNGQKEG